LVVYLAARWVEKMVDEMAGEMVESWVEQLGR
jgi:hypothetical protein